MGPHLHSGGVCPYSSSSSTSKPNSKLIANQKKIKADNMKFQKMLNKLGYYCGSTDGVLGTTSKRAIKKFQKKNNLTKTGKLTKLTKKKITKLYNSKY